MRLRELGLMTLAVVASGLMLSAAPARSQSTDQDEPVMPVSPAMVAMPAVPATITAALAAPVFAERAVPAPPIAPVAPAAPSAAVSSVATSEWEGPGSSRHDGPISNCSELHMEFHGQPGIVESEERTFSKADAKVLRMEELENGGVQVQGWDKDLYSVTACKSADASSHNAKEILSEIKLSVQDGRVSVSVPDRRNDWNVYLLIRTPRAAEVELKSHNGPVSFYGVDGKITAHGTNGPISIQDCSGAADISAVNGPISFSGTGGKLRLHTENGPISLALNAATFGGSGLVADAVNGPLTLRVPTGFQSSFVVESTGHSPVSCHASICLDARKTWDDEHRRIEFGSGAPLIHLSTQNGPISVNTL
jgi:hypothetical protein